MLGWMEKLLHFTDSAITPLVAIAVAVTVLAPKKLSVLTKQDFRIGVRVKSTMMSIAGQWGQHTILTLAIFEPVLSLDL